VPERKTDCRKKWELKTTACWKVMRTFRDSQRRSTASLGEVHFGKELREQASNGGGICHQSWLHWVYMTDLVRQKRGHRMGSTYWGSKKTGGAGR
jgi:hypothetical protein